MKGDDIKGCMRRLGCALLGKEQESVAAVRHIAGEFVDFIGLGLNGIYNQTLREPVPRNLTELVQSLGEGNGRRH